MKEKCKDKLLMIGKCRLVAAFVFALACIGMWGCDHTYTEFNGCRGGYLVAFVDDSLALLRTLDVYNVCEKVGGFSSSENCDVKYDNTGLQLVNYKEQKKMLWRDALDYYVNVKDGFYQDSAVFLYDYDNDKYGFWKIGKQVEFGKKLKWNSPCSGVGGAKFRPWKNGNVLLMGAKGCEFSVLDTSTSEVSEISDQTLSWMEKCDDVTYMDGKILCLRGVYAENKYGVMLDVDGFTRDSLIWYGAKWPSKSDENIRIMGNLFLLNHPSNDLSVNLDEFVGVKIYSLQPLKILSSNTGLANRLKGFDVFVDSLGNRIEYECSDP